MKRDHNTEGYDSLRSRRCIRRRGEQSDRRNINDLPNQLLMEILGKLGCPITAVRCKFVCKLWYSLISSPDFHIDPVFALIVNLPAPGQPRDEPHYISETCDLRKWSGLKLKYLPCFHDLRHVSVLASYKDLLLCSESSGSRRKFFIVNPFTMHWIDLPKSLQFYRHDAFPAGLAVKECPDDPLGYKFRVVRIIFREKASDHFWAQVFDPSRSHWILVLVNQPYQLGWVPTVNQGLVCKGVLHWLAKDMDGPVIAYDPFAPPDTNEGYSCRFIMRSDEMRYNGDVNMVIKECITVSEEHIRMIQLVTFPTPLKQNEAPYLTVWKLENYEEGRWVLENRVYFKDMTFKFSPLQQRRRQMGAAAQECTGDSWFRLLRRRETKHKPEPLACHPNDSHVVYLYFPGNIVSCNLSTKLLKVVSRIDEQAEYYKVGLQAFPFIISSRPTAVPRLR